MFFKKKDKNTIKMMHYEGLGNMPHNATCFISLEDDILKFKEVVGENTAELPIASIRASDYMFNVDFMAKYKNTTVDKAAKMLDAVMFWVIEYTSSQDSSINQISFQAMLANDIRVGAFTRKIKSLIPSEHLKL